MIQANCRARFTADDFDFIVHALSRSPADHVSLGELLTDEATRDGILDSDRLAAALLAGNDHLSISPQLLFYVLARKVLREAGVDDRRLSDYVGSLLTEFSRTAHLRAPAVATGGGDNDAGGSVPRPFAYLSDLLLALQRAANPEQVFLLRAHVGNTALFLTGMFHENVQRRARRRGAPDCRFYEEMGRTNYRAAAGHAVARRCDLHEIFVGLAEQFRAVRLALNELADRLLNLDDGGGAPAILGC